MAEQQTKNNSSANGGASQAANTMAQAAGAAKTAVNVAKAAGKAAAGDIAGAVVDLLKDKNIRFAIIAIVLGVLLIAAFIPMAIGAIISAAIEALKETWSENWDKNWEAQGVSSNGSIFYLYSVGILLSTDQTITDTIRDLFSDKGGDAANKQAGEGSAEFTEKDYENTINSVKDQEALLGKQGAVIKRLEMIKGRVKQRGLQIGSLATTQYALEGVGLSIASGLSETLHHPFLYNGIDWLNSSLNIDLSAFFISDIQALKILAAYCTQHECDLGEADMWELMHYCGWYGVNMSNESLEVSSDSIYTGSSEASFAKEFFGIILEGSNVDKSIYELKAPYIPVWTGSFAPQWYYEEIKQIKDYKERYDYAAASGDTDTLATMHPLKTTTDDETGKTKVDFTAFDKINNFQTYGIIDKLFVSSNATLTVSRTEYHGADAWFDEAMAYFGDLLVQGVTGFDDWSSMVNALMGQWNDAKDQKPTTSTSPNGNLIFKHGGTQKNILIQRFVNSTDPAPVEAVFKGEEGAVYFIREYETDNWEFVPTFTDQNGAVGYNISGLKQDTFYQIFECKTIRVEGKEEYEYIYYDVFNTYFDEEPLKGRQAYQLQLRLDVTYASRSIDDLTLDLIGLWPGDLKDTVIASGGKEYAYGHPGKDVLAAEWTDTYTDANGKKHTMTFSRMYGYQYESYIDYIRSMANMLSINATGLFAPDNGYGDTITSIAKKEAEYYNANNMYGGKKYWDVLKSTGQVSIQQSHMEGNWSAAFITSCAYQAGYLGSAKCFGELSPNHLWCGGLLETLMFNCGAKRYTDANYAPKVGDLIFFADKVGHPEPDSVGIVVEVNKNGYIRVVEGDYGGKLKKCIYMGYAVGTICKSNSQKQRLISCYVRPNYPEVKVVDPLYLHYPGYTQMVGADWLAKYAFVGGQYTTFLAGYGRIRKTQISEYVSALKEQYPDYCTDTLYYAAVKGDLNTVVTEWYNIFLPVGDKEAKQIQLDLFTQLYVRPIVTRQLEENKFDWTLTKYREEILLALVSSSENTFALNNLLKSITQDMKNTISDEEFLRRLMTDDFLRTQLRQQQDVLWQGDPERMQEEWITVMGDILNDLRNQCLAST